MQADAELRDEAHQRVQRIALQVGLVGTLAARGAGANVGRVEVEGDRLPEADQGQRCQQDVAQGLVELAQVTDAETPEEPPGGLGRGDPEAAQLCLYPVCPGNVEIVETLCSDRHRLGHAED